nr:hypothetical protein [Tanacetum cinerariifolium]
MATTIEQQIALDESLVPSTQRTCMTPGFYLIFSLLLNEMNMYNMKLEQFQVNKKFLNILPPEWSKFVIDVKLVRDLHTTNVDQLHTYLSQHEYHANEVRLMHERHSDPHERMMIRKDPPLDQTGGSKRQKEGGEQASASTLSEKATKGTGGSTTGSQSRQMSATESAYAEEPGQTTCQMEETPHLVFETGADDQPIVQTSQHPEWFSQPRRPPLPDRAWNTALPAAQGDAQSWISNLARQTD